MRNFLFILWFLPHISPAQKYEGKCYDPETQIGYTILFLIRPDSTISLTFETINSNQKKARYDHGLYYDYHGNIRKSVVGAGDFFNYDSSGRSQVLPEGQTIFTLDTKSNFIFQLRDENADYLQDKIGNDTLVIPFDSARVFLDRNIAWSYGSVHDSIYITDSMLHAYRGYPFAFNDTTHHLNYALLRSAYAGYPLALNDSMHVSGVEIGTLYLPLDSSAFKSAKMIHLDIGYVNPVTNMPVSFTVPNGKYPFIKGDDPTEFNFFIKNGQLYFFNYNMSCPYLSTRNTIVLNEIK